MTLRKFLTVACLVFVTAIIGHSQHHVRLQSYQTILPCKDSLNNTHNNLINAGECKRCLNWKVPEKRKVIKIINAMSPVTSSEIHAFYNVYKCEIDGEMIFDSRKCKYFLNAGGYIAVYPEDSSEHFYLALVKSCKYDVYFLSTRGSVNDY